MKSGEVAKVKIIMQYNFKKDLMMMTKNKKL